MGKMSYFCPMNRYVAGFPSSDQVCADPAGLVREQTFLEMDFPKKIMVVFLSCVRKASRSVKIIIVQLVFTTQMTLYQFWLKSWAT